MSKDSTQPIITTWTLGNFQSIRETKKLELKPLTIFSGPNSSGKSAVIKSLLMVAQSLGSSASEFPLVLNGKYTQLGDFDHILHHGSDPPEITLGFVIIVNTRNKGTMFQKYVILLVLWHIHQIYAPASFNS